MLAEFTSFLCAAYNFRRINKGGNMARDIVEYLSGHGLTDAGAAPIYSKLLEAVTALKQGSGPASQWAGIIKGLTSKGVKSSEIDNCCIIDHLSSLPPTDKIQRQEVIDQIERRTPRIKRVTLGAPAFAGYRCMTDSRYKERLYILSSEAMAADDLIDDLMYQIEELGFDPSPLLSDPGLVDRLEAKLNVLRKLRPEMWDFQNHHFSSQSKHHGKNVFAHARTTQSDDLFFIEEIQSDWAQKGRRHNWSGGFPKAPLVTHTEQWAGLVARDVLRDAARSQCTRLAWINWSMRNGFTPRRNASGELVDNAFYSTIIPKIVGKAIEKAGGSVGPMTVHTKHGPQEVLGFEITAPVREALLQPQPLYSRSALLPYGAVLPDPQRDAERAQVLRECERMTGSIHTVRFLNRLYDIATGTEVAGRYVNRGIEISLRAKNMVQAARHEAWHFADENFLLTSQRREIRLSFQPGTRLNAQTRRVLLERGEYMAAKQCGDDAHECAAHAFALWSEGALSLDPGKEASLFVKVSAALERLSAWLDERIFGVKVESAEDLFKALQTGMMYARFARREQALESRAQSEHSPA